MTGDFTRKIYTTPLTNSETKYNIFLVRLLIINKKGELASHWTPVTELGKFLEKIYFGSAERCSYAKTLACPYCCSSFFPTKNSVSVKEIKDEIRKSGDEERNRNFLAHLEECKCDRLTSIRFPSEEYLSFNKHKSFIEPAIRYNFIILLKLD